MTIGVLIADDHALVRDGLKLLVESHADLRVLATAGDGRAAAALAEELRPDVILMDISMPLMNGIEAARRIRATRADARIVMLSVHDDAEHVHRALEAGALGYLLKDSSGAEVADAVRAVHAGRRYLAERINQLVIEGYAGQGRGASPLQSLSRRERDILQLIVDGHSNPEAARLLSLSVKTVETYRARMMRKLGMKNLAQLVKFAVNHGLTQIR